MKVSLLTLFIFFSCFSFVSAQKKYLVKYQMLNGKVRKGILIKVDSNGIWVLSNKKLLNFIDPKATLIMTDFFYFKEIRTIKIRDNSSIKKGMIIGTSIGLITSIIVANNVINNYNRNYQPTNSIISFSSPKSNAFLAYFTLVPFLTSGGGGIGSLIGGHYFKNYQIDNRSANFKELKTELKKYEWYHADESVVK